jgi:hypothetical protein
MNAPISVSVSLRSGCIRTRSCCVFSGHTISQCLSNKERRRFFSYTPSKNNDSFRDPGPSKFIDNSTLDGVHRKTSPFYGQLYPFRFIEPEEFAALLEQRGLTVLRNERIGRTYSNRSEYFEFVSIHAEKAN